MLLSYSKWHTKSPVVQIKVKHSSTYKSTPSSNHSVRRQISYYLRLETKVTVSKDQRVTSKDRIIFNISWWLWLLLNIKLTKQHTSALQGNINKTIHHPFHCVNVQFIHPLSCNDLWTVSRLCSWAGQQWTSFRSALHTWVPLEFTLSTVVTEVEDSVCSITGDKPFSKIVVILGLSCQYDWIKICLRLVKHICMPLELFLERTGTWDSE